MSERMKAPNIRDKFIDKVIDKSFNQDNVNITLCEIGKRLKNQFEMDRKLEVGIVTKFYSEDGKYLFSKLRRRGKFDFEDHVEQFVDESVPGEKETLYIDEEEI